ncbi:MAG: Peptidoglycan D,D-transpeptidase MrdA [Chlamydiales bacterium]|nr:Peptidoglycan D,D-transpeptidase MrdA [Chlamydiales bacterium]
MAIVQHDEKVDEARRPQTREVAERAERATICDRFQIPLAINKTQYNAGVCYGGIRELPRTVWEKDLEGKRIKRSFRKEYITALSKKLGEELHLEPGRVEDQIHAKAAILGNVPCLLKENISEQEYFRLKMLEKDWPGIHAEIAAKRCYPLGRVGGEVIGYLGPISRPQYQAITNELQELRECLASQEEGEKPTLPDGYATVEEVELRLHQLEKTAYTINDFVGKMGVEAAFDTRLRGLRGKHIYLSDTRGNFVQELPGSKPPVPGKRVELTLSAELQAYAEKLLAEYDQHPPSMRPAAVKKREKIPENQPWIRGGAIVAMEPHTGEVYAMASFPRFDPNDFIRSGAQQEVADKKARVNQWLESEHYIASVWDLKQPLTRERYDPYSETFYEEQLELDWETFLSCTLPESSLVRHMLETKATIGEAVWIQRKVEQLVALFETDQFAITPAKVFDVVYQSAQDVPTGVMLTLQERDFFEETISQLQPQIESICLELSPYFKFLPLNYEKLLLTDLYRLVVDAGRFTPVLTELMGQITLKEYREAAGRMVSVDEAVCEIVRALYREHDFKQWREEEFKGYLASRREEESAAGRKYARPYIDYLDQAENERFALFWEEYRWEFMALFLTGEKASTRVGLEPYLDTLSSWAKELSDGAHCALPWVYHYHRLKDLIQPLAQTSLLFPYLKGLRRFTELDRPLVGNYSGLHGSCEKNLASAFYPTYGYGFARSHAFRQATMIGSIFKLIPAYEALRQRYEQNVADLNPLTIIDDKHRTWGKGGGWNVGYTLDGRTIPIYYRGGRLPRSEHAGVGRVDVVKALETSSNPYFALLAGDILEDPEDLCAAAAQFGFGCKTGIDLPGEYIGSIPKDVAYNRTGLYAMSIGQHTMIGTPLQTAVMLSALANGGEVLKPQIVQAEKQVRWTVFMPGQVQSLLLEGLRQVVMGGRGTARSLKNQFSNDLVKQIVGKTSTADIVERFSLDGKSGKLASKDVWFGAISYESDDFSKPELVVIVYLKQGEWGKDAAPLVAKIVQKWREIKDRHS